MTIRISSNQVLDVGIDSMNNSLNDATAWQKKLAQVKTTARLQITFMPYLEA